MGGGAVVAPLPAQASRPCRRTRREARRHRSSLLHGGRVVQRAWWATSRSVHTAAAGVVAVVVVPCSSWRHDA